MHVTITDVVLTHIFTYITFLRPPIKAPFKSTCVDLQHRFRQVIKGQISKPGTMALATAINLTEQPWWENTVKPVFINSTESPQLGTRWAGTEQRDNEILQDSGYQKKSMETEDTFTSSWHKPYWCPFYPIPTSFPIYLRDHLGSLVRSPSVSKAQDSYVPGNWSGLGEKAQTENAKTFAAVVKRETFLHPWLHSSQF